MNNFKLLSDSYLAHTRVQDYIGLLILYKPIVYISPILI